MKKGLFAIIRKILEAANFEIRRIEYSERILINQGRILAAQQLNNSTTQPKRQRILNLFPIRRGWNSSILSQFT